MSHGSVDERPEIGAPERGPSVTRGRNPCRRCGGVTCRRMWDIAASCVSLHRRSASFETPGSESGCLDPDYVQDSRRHRRSSASLLCKHWNYIERDRNACNKSVSRLCKQEWLSAGSGSLLMSLFTTSSIVCSFTSCNKRMRFSFPTTFGSSAIKRS